MGQPSRLCQAKQHIFQGGVAQQQRLPNAMLTQPRGDLLTVVTVDEHAVSELLDFGEKSLHCGPHRPEEVGVDTVDSTTRGAKCALTSSSGLPSARILPRRTIAIRSQSCAASSM